MEERIGSLIEYLDVIERIKEQYVNSLHHAPFDEPLIFRGMSNEAYQLLPAVFRTQQDREGIENLKYLAYIDDDTRLIKEFRNEACGLIRNIDLYDLPRWAEYAQHYGVPTRMLDFTFNALVALYFACIHNREKNGLVWIIHVKNYRKYETTLNESLNGKKIKEVLTDLFNGVNGIKMPITYLPYYFDQRLSAQSSCFMVWGNIRKPLEQMVDNKHYMTPVKPDARGVINSKEDANHFLYKLIINSNSKFQIIRQLDSVGINQRTLFPGLDGIGKRIEYRYRFNYDETKSFF